MAIRETKGIGGPVLHAAAQPATKPGRAEATVDGTPTNGKWVPEATVRALDALTRLPIAISFIANTNDDIMAQERKLTPWAVAPPPREQPYGYKDFVDDVLARARGGPISSLHISGHGSSGAQRLSQEETLSARMTEADKAQLLRLKPHFAKGAEVTLEGCAVGATKEGEELLTMLAQLWGVRVRGSIIPQYPIPGLEGSSNVAVPGVDGKPPTIMRERAPLNTLWRHEVDEEKMENHWKSMREYRAHPEWLNTSFTSSRHYFITKALSHIKTDEQAELVLAFFRTAKPEARRDLYASIEARAWKGDFHRSPWPLQTDDLFRLLPQKQSDELKRLLNE